MDKMVTSIEDFKNGSSYGYHPERMPSESMLNRGSINIQAFRTYVENHPHLTLQEIAQAWGHRHYFVTYFLLKTIGWYQRKEEFHKCNNHLVQIAK
ncbi:MAG TPA: hypothetical protein VNJ29_02465 [Candidatus Nitrosotenuis sp.]|jgi:hypothetical protein|nr:hypothetical protein [Candidatus Nitrosotenuis sp.]